MVGGRAAAGDGCAVVAGRGPAAGYGRKRERQQKRAERERDVKQWEEDDSREKK